MITGGPLKYITSAQCSPQHILIHEGMKEKGHFKHMCHRVSLYTFTSESSIISTLGMKSNIDVSCLILFACPEGY